MNQGGRHPRPFEQLGGIWRGPVARKDWQTPRQNRCGSFENHECMMNRSDDRASLVRREIQKTNLPRGLFFGISCFDA
jgi:hypothetical protein